MLVVDRPEDLARHLGRPLGPSAWIAVDQDMIDRFAEATGDNQWIHVDVARAGRELPGGRPIAHGYLTLALLPRMIPQVFAVRRESRRLNYGSNRVRFTNAVPAGARVRLHQTFKTVEPVEGGVRLVSDCRVEIEGEERPALVAEVIALIYG